MTTHAVHRVVPLALASPLDAFFQGFPRGQGAFLLDGEGGPERAGLARTALFGGEPVMSFRAVREEARGKTGALRARVTIAEEGRPEVSVVVDDPLLVLRDLLARRALRATALQASPLPLRAGAVGYLGYEVGQMLERLPCRARARADGGMPDISLFFHDWVLGRAQGPRDTGEAWLSVVGRGDDDAEAARRADETVSRVRARLVDIDAEARARGVSAERRAPPRDAAPKDVAELARALGAKAALSESAYLDAVARAKEHIEAGDAFEICLTNALEVAFEGDPLALWRALRDANPSPFAAFLDFPEGAVVSSSPERFLALDRHGVAESRPIKGTRPRGRSAAEDARLSAELETSEKDRAENTMIVDLVRNDLGRVCRFGSVHVPDLCAIERYPSVHQMVSTVRGHLVDGKDAVDLVRACFPPGSMTGAPKIEAMRILEELEPVERGVYSGALGFFDVGGTLDLSVVIRTAIVREGVARVAVGGAVVADSSPPAEYDETLVKARALLEALARVRAEAAP